MWGNFRWALDSARAAAADLIVLSGDLALREGSKGTYAEIAAIMTDTKIPYLVMPGNHDDRSMFASAFGRRYARFDGGTLDMSVHAAGTSMYFLDSGDAMLVPRQLAWLDMRMWAHRRASERGELTRAVLLWIHHPIITGFHRYMDKNYPLADSETVLGLLSHYRDTLDITVFCGHYHVEDTRQEVGITQHVCPSLYVQIDPTIDDFLSLSNIPGYRLIRLENGAVTTAAVYREETTP